MKKLIVSNVIVEKINEKVHFIKRKLDFDAETMDKLVNNFIGAYGYRRVLESVNLTNDYIIVIYKEGNN